MTKIYASRNWLAGQISRERAAFHRTKTSLGAVAVGVN